MLSLIKLFFYVISPIFFYFVQGMELPTPPSSFSQGSPRMPEKENTQPIDGGYPLHSCAAQGNINGIMHWIEKRNVSVHSEVSPGHTPLYFAIMARQIGAIVLLLNYGANKERVCSLADVKERLQHPAYQEVVNALDGKIDRTEELSIQEAIAFGSPDRVKSVLERKTYSTESYYPYNTKLLNIQEIATAQALEQALNLAAQPADNVEAQQACVRKVSAIIDLLMQANPELVNAHYTYGSPLHQAACLNIPEIIPLLIAHKFPVNGRDETGRTSLYCALEQSSIDAANVLLLCGAERYHLPYEVERVAGAPFWLVERVLFLCTNTGLERASRNCPALYEWYQELVEHYGVLEDVQGIPFVPVEEPVRQEVYVSHDTEEPAILVPPVSDPAAQQNAAFQGSAKGEQKVPATAKPQEAQNQQNIPQAKQKDTLKSTVPQNAPQVKTWSQNLLSNKWTKKIILSSIASLLVGCILYKIFVSHAHNKHTQPAPAA